MSLTKIKGTGVVAPTDFKDVEWVGATKGGQAVTIRLNKAINMGNVDWTFADEDEVVGNVVFTATYNNTDEPSESTEEPFEIEIDGLVSGASEIMLGAGVFKIGGNKVGLTRGGGQFTVERTFREIGADGDRGPVEGRIVLDKSRATLTMNALQILTKVTDLYPAMTTETI